MIYLVTETPQLFNEFHIVSVQESLYLLKPLTVVGLDTETSGLSFLNDRLLTLQLGNKDIQVVVDCTTVDVKLYKDYLESDRLFIAHNFKFDYKWLLKEGIVIRNTFDTFIAEKVLNLGLTLVRCDLQSTAKRHLDVYIDKSVRGDIIVYGLTSEVIKYAAYDVVYLERIMDIQKKIAKERNQELAVLMECAFTPVLAYIEFCGIKLDIDKWKYKMSLDNDKLTKAETALNTWVVNYCTDNNKLVPDIWDKGKNTKYPPGVYAVEPALSLFDDWNTGPKCVLNWSSSKQLIPLFEELGFNLLTKDKKTGKDKKSAGIAQLRNQVDPHGIIKLYADYSAADKRVTSFGQNFLNAVSDNTNRIHVEFNQLISSGRMSCGKGNSDSDEFDDSDSVNIQQLPNDTLTRECFIPEEGKLIIAADYSDKLMRII